MKIINVLSVNADQDHMQNNIDKLGHWLHFVINPSLECAEKWRYNQEKLNYWKNVKMPNLGEVGKIVSDYGNILR